MFCPTDIRRKYGAKIIRKYGKALKQTELLGLIENAVEEKDIPWSIRTEFDDMPGLQLYMDEYIEIAYGARATSKTHLLVSPVRHIEKFETLEDLSVLKKIIDAGWAIIRYTGLKDASLGLSLKPGEVPIPHVHFHINCTEVIDEAKLLELMERKYFYVSTI
jgi:diadenosine tetraphosphate (Ap4A) HIT family hydrolase